MKGLLLAASFGLALFSTAAAAADLDDDPPPPRYGGSAYDDPRYSDIYRYPARPVPPAPIYRESDPVYGPPPRRAHVPPACLPRHVIRDRLIREGWHDFELRDFDGDIAKVKARRPSGRPFMLTIERCEGTVVDARPLGVNRVPYAYDAQPRRWDGPRHRPY